MSIAGPSVAAKPSREKVDERADATGHVPPARQYRMGAESGQTLPRQDWHEAAVAQVVRNQI